MYIYRLAHTLGDLGHHVDVVHCVDAYHLQHPAEPEVSFAEHPNVNRIELRSPYGFLSPLLTQQSGHPALKQEKIRKVLDSKAYDVIHYHNISLLGPSLLALESKQGPAVKLYTTHEHWLICPTHVLWKFNQKACDKPACLACTLRSKRPPQLWRYGDLLAKSSQHVDHFLSPSRFTAQMHAERGFSQPVGHLPYFIEPVDREWQEPAPRPQTQPYFLFVGRLEQIKGLQTLIQIWDQVSEIDLLVAGKGSYEAELRQQARHNPHIKFLGALPQRELGALYVHALACIVPSITYETFGMIIIEAFARKTPVIVRDLGALPEVVNESGGGFVYRTDEELAAAMTQIATSEDIRKELGEKGYAAFIKWWSKEAHLKRYLELIQRTSLERLGKVL
jgi:glycosyltransferase involved in cell wall biosynthesis